MQLVPVRTNQMNDKIVFRYMQKVLFSHADLEKAIDKLIAIPAFSHFEVREDIATSLHKLKYAELMKWPGSNFPCFADKDSKGYEIECICWQVSRERPDEAQVYIRCSNCSKLQHRKCI